MHDYFSNLIQIMICKECGLYLHVYDYRKHEEWLLSYISALKISFPCAQGTGPPVVKVCLGCQIKVRHHKPMDVNKAFVEHKKSNNTKYGYFIQWLFERVKK